MLALVDTATAFVGDRFIIKTLIAPRVEVWRILERHNRRPFGPFGEMEKILDSADRFGRRADLTQPNPGPPLEGWHPSS
jgi:hypothetical protein